MSDACRSPGKRGTPIATFSFFVVLLSGMYLGAYYSLVRPVTQTTIVFTFGIDPITTVQAQYGFQDQGSLGARTMKILFAPAHWFDRQIRPELWETKRGLL